MYLVTRYRNLSYACFFVFISISTELVAQDDLTINRLETDILDRYNSLLVKKVTSDLLDNHKFIWNSQMNFGIFSKIHF